MCLFLSCNISSRKEYAIDVINSSYEGQIIDKYIDNSNHAAKVVKVYTINNDTLNITVDFYPESWNFLNVGDFIVKKYGKRSIEIKKKKRRTKRISFIYSKLRNIFILILPRPFGFAIRK